MAEIRMSFARPLRMCFIELLRPSETLPDFMTSWSFELMFSCEDFLLFDWGAIVWVSTTTYSLW